MDERDGIITPANNTNTALRGCVYSKDAERARRIAEQMQAGSDWANGSEKSGPKTACAGFKQSGTGSKWGSAGILAYCDI
jgi:acyl-CoA reductase-like NAD-dependent aldehyde dehydrogenase